MPQISDLTVKKADGLTDIVFNGVVPSAGDKSPAIFKALDVGANSASRPELRVSSSSNRARTTRVVEATFVFPTVQTVGGASTVAHRTLFEVRATIPTGAPDDDVEEAVAEAVNLLGTALMRSCFTTGYAPS